MKESLVRRLLHGRLATICSGSRLLHEAIVCLTLSSPKRDPVYAPDRFPELIAHFIARFSLPLVKVLDERVDGTLEYDFF